jgi:hypothetical protein
MRRSVTVILKPTPFSFVTLIPFLTAQLPKLSHMSIRATTVNKARSAAERVTAALRNIVREYRLICDTRLELLPAKCAVKESAVWQSSPSRFACFFGRDFEFLEEVTHNKF